MTNSTTTQTSFVIERDFSVAPSKVFQAWADPAAKRSWSDCHVEHTTEYSLDFRPLGRETHRVMDPERGEQVIEKVFFDIVDSQRIVFAYDISVKGRRLSVSLVTVEFIPTSTGTRMSYVEQLTYLDGHEDSAARLLGTQGGFDRLALHLQELVSAVATAR